VTRGILTAPVTRVNGAGSTSAQDLLAIEEPLEIRLNGRTISITMRTPGDDFELVAGFLFGEGILRRADDVRGISRPENIGGNPRQKQNSVDVSLNDGVEVDFERLERHFYTTSSCGVCGKASIEALQVQGCPVLPRETLAVSPETIHGLPGALRREQAAFERTGGIHAAALFQAGGELIGLREDVGRHNAVDKVIGAEFLSRRTPLHDRVLFVSGRASFELTQKALTAGVPMLAAVGAPSSLAVEVARRFGMTLLGFVRDGRFNIYSGAWRIR
jgi:FdhD protein